MEELSPIAKNIANIIDRLHEEFGVCGHCGKRDCAGRNDNSVLKGSVPIEKILKILNDSIGG